MPSKQAKQRRNSSVVTGRKGPSATVIAGITVVLLFVVVIAYGLYRVSTQQAGTVPTNAVADGVPLGNASAPVTVDLYVDFQCPICRAFEASAGNSINSMITSGKAKVIYHPLAFVAPGVTGYSTRASAASGCAAEDKVFPQFAKLLFDNQPPEGGQGLPNSQLVAYGQQAGAGPNFAKCVNDQTYAKWSAKLTDDASKANVTGTPTVLVNGKPVDVLSSPTALTDAVAKAAK